MPFLCGVLVEHGLIESVQFYASVKEASLNKLSYKRGCGRAA
jgi:hypothetical protein